MFLNSVILVLQETLEAALLISVLLTFTHQLKLTFIWLIPAILIGFLGAYFYGENIGDISELFNYVGQEVFNAIIQVAIVISILIAAFIYTQLIHTHKQVSPFAFSVFASFIIALAITREGSEIYIYLAGALSQIDFAMPALTGSAIGTGIGMSIGILCYYGVNTLTGEKAYIIGMILLSLVAGNMASQAVLLLTQADWLPTTAVLWDTSSLLSEYSLIGRLLYGLIGYEATPSILQFLAYLGVVLAILFIGRKNIIRNNASHETTH